MTPQDDTDELDTSEQDAVQNFGFDDVSPVVQSCSDCQSAPVTVSTDKKHWIEISMVDQEGNPIRDQAYRIRIPDGSDVTGTLDAKGVGRVNGIDAGNCQITFPGLDRTVWEPRK